jgi:hypothetical protein
MQLIQDNNDVPQLYTSMWYQLQHHYNSTQVYDI